MVDSAKELKLFFFVLREFLVNSLEVIGLPIARGWGFVPCDAATLLQSIFLSCGDLQTDSDRDIAACVAGVVYSNHMWVNTLFSAQ